MSQEENIVSLSDSEDSVEDDDVEHSTTDEQIIDVDLLIGRHSELLLSTCRIDKDIGIRALLRHSLPQVVNCCNKNGQSGLSLACSTGNLEVVKELIEIDEIDVNTTDNEGDTPLMMASQAGYEEIVRFFVFHLRSQIDIDMENNNGFTALMKAALHGRSNCTRMLIIAGADVTKRDWGRGLRADEWAIRCGMIETSVVIQNVSTCNINKQQREELAWEKHVHPIVDFCNWAGRRIKKAVGCGGDQWVTEAGSLYHLASHAANLNSSLLAVSLGDRKGSSAAKQINKKINAEMVCVDECTDDVINDDVLLVETTYLNQRRMKHKVTQRCLPISHGKVPIKGCKPHVKGGPPPPTPTLRLINPSPTKQEKSKKKKLNYNLLTVPKRSFKAKKCKA